MSDTKTGREKARQEALEEAAKLVENDKIYPGIRHFYDCTVFKGESICSCGGLSRIAEKIRRLMG